MMNSSHTPPSTAAVPNASSHKPNAASPAGSADSFLTRFGAEAGLLLLCLFLFFWHLGSMPLMDYDEALYVTCARQMAVSGDWVTPRLNTRLLERPGETRIAFFEKPILVYWASAGAMRVFGPTNLWAARLPVALASLLTTLIVYLAGLRWFGRRAGLLSALVYATSPMTLIDARQMTTDALLVLWLTVAMLCFWQVQKTEDKEQDTERQNTGERASDSVFSAQQSSFPASSLFWLMCGLAVLTKGVVGLLLPFLIIGVYLLLDRWFVRVRLHKTLRPRLRAGIQMRPARVLWTGIARLRPVYGLLVFLLVAAPWHTLIALRLDLDAQSRTWVQEYLLRQHIGRFRGLDAVHNQPIFTFFIYFLLGFFPWACFAPAAFRAAKERLRHREEESDSSFIIHQSSFSPSSFSPSSFLLTWFWTVFVFFSLGAAKLPTYITPAYPAAALLLGRWLDGALAGKPAAWEGSADSALVGRTLRRGALVACGVGIALLIGALLAPDRTNTGVPIPRDLIRFGMHIALLFTMGSGTAWFCFRQADQTLLPKAGLHLNGRFTRIETWRTWGVGLLAVMMFFAIGVVSTEGYAAVRNSVTGPYQQLASATRADAQAGIPVLFYGITPRRPSMLFYTEVSPFERKETPFLPFLAHCLTSTQREADVIMTGKTFESIVLPEIQKLPGASIRILQTRGPADGWRLTRVFVPSSYIPPPLPRHKSTLWETVSY